LIEVQYDMKVKTKGAEQELIKAHEFINVKSFKAKGKRLTVHPVKKINLLEPINIEEEPVSPQETDEIVTKAGSATNPDKTTKQNKEDDSPDAVQMELPL
jgi:topoisomerase IV subunit A